MWWRVVTMPPFSIAWVGNGTMAPSSLPFINTPINFIKLKDMGVGFDPLICA